MGSKKVPSKVKKTKKVVEPVAAAPAAPEWVLVGKLHKTRDFKVNSKIGPADSLSDAMKRLTTWNNDKGASISDYGTTKKTNEYFGKRLLEYAKKKYPYLRAEKLKSSVAFTLLNVEPADVTYEGAKDFHLYVRLDALKSGRITLNVLK